MKKTILCLWLSILITSTLHAQYRINPMTWSMEVLFNPIASETQTIELPRYGVKGRIFFNPSWCMRVQLGFDYKETNNRIYSIDNNDQWVNTNNSKTMFTIFPGFEFHFIGNKRLSPYVGGEIGFGIDNNYIKITNSDDNKIDKTDATNYLLGFNIVSGMDFYLYQGLYLGVELSFGFNNYRENNSQTAESTNSAQANPKDYIDIKGVGFSCVPALRLGWSF